MKTSLNPNAAREEGQKYHNPCKHPETKFGSAYGFVCSVAVHPYTEENPRAHGGCNYTETCSACGAQRSVNANCGSYEYGTWGLPSAEIKRREREEERRAQEAAEEAAKQESARLAEIDRRIAWKIGGDLRLTVLDMPVRLSAYYGERGLLINVRYGAQVDVYEGGKWIAADKLRQAARDWQDGPEDNFATHFYPAIGKLLAA